MARVSQATKKDAVYVWAVQSSQAYGGDVLMYEVRLNQDGTVSCNCAGWRFVKKGQARGCKHTRAVGEEAIEMFARFSRGEDLPRHAPTEDQLARFQQTRVGRSASQSTPTNYGRFVDLD